MLAVLYMVGALCRVPYKPQKPVPATAPSDKYINEIQQKKKL